MQRNKNLRALSSEHHRALTLSREIKKACQNGTNDSVLIERIQNVFMNELLPHFDIEEQAILPELAKIGEDALVQRTLDDHRRLKDLLADLDDVNNLLNFAENLKEHVRFEERELFEACQSLLDPTTLEQIGTEINRIQ